MPAKMNDMEVEDLAELTVAVMEQWNYYNEQLVEITKNMRQFIKNNKDIAELMHLSVMVCTTSLDLGLSDNPVTDPIVTPDVTALLASDRTLEVMIDAMRESARMAKYA